MRRSTLLFAVAATAAFAVLAVRQSVSVGQKPGANVSGSGPESAAGLAKRAFAVFKARCYQCHGVQFNGSSTLNILDPDLLTAERKKPYVVAGKPANSYLFKRILENEMPPNNPLADDEKALIRTWIEAGAPPPLEDSRRFITQKEVLQAIQSHLAQTPREERKFQRYFTLAHLHNAFRQVTDYDLRLYRAALSKTINSLSQEADIVLPKALDKDETVYAVDLRRIGWHRADNDVWSELLAVYPYGLKEDQSEDTAVREAAAEVYERAGTDVPFLRADWFVSAATRPPLYHTILKIPEDAKELEKNLRVNVEQNVRESLAIRVGLMHSNVSRHNRVLERHTSVHGAYWKSYDFKSSGGKGNILRFPFGPVKEGGDDAVNRLSFVHDGGEIIFNLPNRLQAYMLTDSKDKRINAGPISIVRDSYETSGSPEIVNGLSCMHCHRHGMIRDFKEVVRDGNALAGENRFKVQRLYPAAADVERELDKDQRSFLDALDRTIGPFLRVGEDKTKDIREFPEPIGAVARHYAKDLILDDVAAELGLADAKRLNVIIETNSKLRDLGIGTIANKGSVKREVWDTIDGNSLFQNVALELKLGVPIVVEK